jgi:ankyrin repeat protein
LVENGANIYIKNNWGKTALYYRRKNIIVILNNLLTEKKYGEALIESQKLLQKIAQ